MQLVIVITECTDIVYVINESYYCLFYGFTLVRPHGLQKPFRCCLRNLNYPEDAGSREQLAAKTLTCLFFLAVYVSGYVNLQLTTVSLKQFKTIRLLQDAKCSSGIC